MTESWRVTYARLYEIGLRRQLTPKEAFQLANAIRKRDKELEQYRRQHPDKGVAPW